MKQYAIFRAPGRVLVGIEPDGFNVIKLAREYGSGTYEIAMFVGDKVEDYYVHQVVDERIGPPKKTEPLPEGLLPGPSSKSP